MPWQHPAPEDFDHAHDLRKNWQPNIPLRLEPGPLSTAMDIALIVRGMSNLVEAGKLIEQFANTAKAAGRLQGVEDAYKRIDALLPKVKA